MNAEYAFTVHLWSSDIQILSGCSYHSRVVSRNGLGAFRIDLVHEVIVYSGNKKNILIDGINLPFSNGISISVAVHIVNTIWIL